MSDLIALYAEQFAPLVAIVTGEYAIEEAEAEEIAHDAMLSVLLHLGKISDPARWLEGAVRCASEHHVRGVRS